MKVSIIVPVYNVERFIRRCLDSLVSQSFVDLEIILVDDGSTDESVKIIEKFAKKDSRIRLIKNKHMGPNAARKAGIENATGDYIMFVDADDYIEKNAVEILMNEFGSNDVDVIRFEAKYSKRDKKVQPFFNDGQSRIIEHDEIIYNLLTTYKLNSLWSQIYKVSMLKNIKSFDYRITFAEDFLVNLEVHQNTKKMLILNKVLYYYCDNPDSITHSKKKVIGNIKNRIIASHKAIRYANKNIKDLKIRKKVFCVQLGMVKDLLFSLKKVVRRGK